MEYVSQRRVLMIPFGGKNSHRLAYIIFYDAQCGARRSSQAPWVPGFGADLNRILRKVLCDISEGEVELTLLRLLMG